MNGSEPRRKLRKRLRYGTGLTKGAKSSFWSEKRDGEENEGIHDLSKEVTHRVQRVFLIYYFVVTIAVGISFFVLGNIGLVNKYSLAFISICYFCLFANGRKILRSYLDKQERQALDRLKYLM